jgi:hypothetical protein
MKPHTEKSNKHGLYSLWEDIEKADESMCGVYLTYEELSILTANNHTIRIGFPLTIGFDMLLKLQSFDMFPNCAFGDLQLVIKVNPNALVWSCTNPNLFMKNGKLTINAKMDNDSTNYIVDHALGSGVYPITHNDYYDHRLVQVRTDGIARSCFNLDHLMSSEVVDAVYESFPLRIEPEALRTTDAVSTIMGFTLQEEVKVALKDYYSRVPFEIPSENVFIQNYSTGPTASGLKCSMTMPLGDAKEIIIFISEKHKGFNSI